MSEGDAVQLAALARRAALHRAAPALQRGLTGEGAGVARHRPALDLCEHHLHAAGSRIRRHGQPALRADQTSARSSAASSPTTSIATWSTASPRRWRTSWSRVSRGEEEWTTPLDKFLGSPSSTRSRGSTRPSPREQVSQARELGKEAAHRQADHGAHWAASVPFVQIGTKDDEEKPRFAGLRPGAEDGCHHARGCDGAVQAAAHARCHGRGRADRRQRRALRPLREVRAPSTPPSRRTIRTR